MARRPKISVQHVQTPVTLDNIAPLGRIGVLSLATDFNIEQDLRRIFPPGFQILTNRITNANPLTFANLRAMAGDVTRAAAGILPGYGIDAIIYGCTSGTIAIGNTRINELVHAAWPGIPHRRSPGSALLRSLQRQEDLGADTLQRRSQRRDGPAISRSGLSIAEYRWFRF